VEDTQGVVWDESLSSLPDRSIAELLEGIDRQGVVTSTVETGRQPRRPLDYEAPGWYRTDRGVMYVPFWPTPARVLQADGHLWRTAGDVNDYRIARTTWSGDTTLVIESRRPPAPVGAAERDSAIAQVRERVGQELDWSRIPAEKPVVDGLLTARDGRLWVRAGAAGAGDGPTYDLFGRDGVYQGTAVTDLRVRPFVRPVIRGDTVWAVVTDALDVQYVVRAVLRDVAAM
jgi:hypothetical protein